MTGSTPQTSPDKNPYVKGSLASTECGGDDDFRASHIAHARRKIWTLLDKLMHKLYARWKFGKVSHDILLGGALGGVIGLGVSVFLALSGIGLFALAPALCYLSCAGLGLLIGMLVIPLIKAGLELSHPAPGYLEQKIVNSFLDCSSSSEEGDCHEHKRPRYLQRPSMLFTESFVKENDLLQCPSLDEAFS